MSEGRDPDVPTVERGVLARRVGPFFWVALALPLLGYLAFIGLVEAKRWGSPAIEVRIEGYDPRDPLRGQYLNYRLKVQGGDPSSATGFACAGPPVDGVSPVLLYEGARPSVCARQLSAEFVASSHRYYVQQDRGRELERAVMDGRASIVLRVVGESQIVVDELRIDGRPVD